MNFWQSMSGLLDKIHIPLIHVSDVIEILIITIVIYYFIKSLKNTRTFVLLKAISIIFFLYFIAEIFSFDAIKIIFQSLAIVALFAAIVIFQPELRKTLEKLGTIGFNNFSIKEIKNAIRKKQSKENLRYSDKTINELANACFSLGEVKTGALIVIERDIPLNDYIATGIDLNADISSALLINIFEKNTPLHDGALITIGDKIISGTCYLPLSDNPNISKHLGTRHRAAIGVSEVMDCLVIVVSEETGRVSFVQNGQITVCKKKEDLIEKLKEFQIKETVIKKKPKLTHNLGLKIVSILISFVSWVLIINAADPIITKVIEDVPIQIINQESISNLNKTFNVVSGDTVDVVVKDYRSVVDTLKSEDIRIIADMSKLSYVFSVPLSATAKYSSTEVTFLKENTMTVELDEIISKEFPLTFVKNGTPSKGIYVSKVTSSVDGIVVTGPQKLINTIDRVEFLVDITGATENFTQTTFPVIYDKNGDVIDKTLYTLNKQSVLITTELLNTKEIPLDISLSQQTANTKYELSILDYNPKTIYIAGTDANLESISQLNIEIKSEIDSLSTTQTTFDKEINIIDYLPDGIYCASADSKILIQINYEPFQTKTLTFTSNDIRIDNKLENYNVYFDVNEFLVDILGKEEDISNITIEDIQPYIDLSTLTEGNYNLPIMFNIINNINMPTNINTTIEIIKLETE